MKVAPLPSTALTLSSSLTYLTLSPTLRYEFSLQVALKPLLLLIIILLLDGLFILIA